MRRSSKKGLGNPLFCPFPGDAPGEVGEIVAVGGQERTIITRSKVKEGRSWETPCSAPSLTMPLER